MLRMILGLVTPDRGSVSVAGTTVHATTRHALRRNIGYVVQQGGLFPHLTVYRNVALPAQTQQWPTERIRRRVQALADMVGFDHAILTRYPHQLSGGQRQRVGLIRALVLDPPILLLDEPLAALDPLVRAEVQQQLHRLFTTLRKTVVFVTHDVREAVMLGHTITLMTAGRVVQHGVFAEFVRQPTSPFVTAFLNAQLPPPAIQAHL